VVDGRTMMMFLTRVRFFLAPVHDATREPRYEVQYTVQAQTMLIFMFDMVFMAKIVRYHSPVKLGTPRNAEASEPATLISSVFIPPAPS
jgi:hypothetical protein